MKTQFYVLAPVEVVKVTNENLADVAAWCGGKVAAVESRRVPGRMDSYVWVPTPKGNSISWAFPGMYITKRLVVTIKDEMKYTYQVSRRDYFSRNYFETPTEAIEKTWEKGSKKGQTKNQAPKPEAPKAQFKSKAELQEEPAPKKTQPAKYLHTHSVKDSCAENCVERTTDGVHIYSDTRVTIEKENDMERSKHGYPVLTEEEAAERKLEAGTPEEVTPEQGLENVKNILGAEEIKGEDFVGSSFDEGQMLEGGEIVESDSKGFFVEPGGEGDTSPAT